MPISVPSSSPPPAPAPYLFGAEARVFHEGLLYHKPTFLRPFRPVAALLRSTQLRLTDYATSQLRSYSLRDASLSTHVNSRRLIITLADSARLVFQAPSPADFEHWRLSITDVVQWRFDHFYSLEHQLGKGAFATVHRARYLETGDVTAVKVVPVESLCPDDWKYLQTELDVARLAKHPNVVMALDLFQSRQFVHIVLELVPGGTLRDFVARHGPLSEKIARPILADVLRAVLYIHELGFVHRDLKPENILCTSLQLPTTVKLIDFGLSRRIPRCTVIKGGELARDGSIGPGGLMSTPVGTPHFVAPEVLSSLAYGREVDLFAIGVIFFWMLSGHLPFNDSDPDRLAEKIRRTDYNFDDSIWKGVSEGAKDLIRKLLERSPCVRIGAVEALTHAWVTSKENLRRLDSGPGDEIVVREWKADPEFEGSQASDDSKNTE